MTKDKDIFDDNLEKEAPMLHSIGKHNPFTVPDGYFDALPAQIMDKVRRDAETRPAFGIHKLFWLFRPQWMVATFMVVVAICFFFRNGKTNAVSYEAIAANIPDSVIVQSLQNNIDHVDVASLEEANKNAGVTTMLPQQLAQDTTNEQITNYLINNGIDASDIENEL